MIDRRIVVGVLALLVTGGVGAVALRPVATSPDPAAASTTAVPPTTVAPPAPTAPSTPPSNACTTPNFTTSAHKGGVTYGSYYVTNNMWNPLSVTQTLWACNYDSWYVESTMTSQGGAVQTYPNSQMTFAHPPTLRSLRSLRSSFADASTPSGSGYDYEYAYDVWVNGYGGAGTSELMIWNYNNGQSPGGSPAGHFTDRGRTYDVFVSGSASSGDYVAFVATSNFTSGALDLVDFFHHAVAEKWVHRAGSARLWQVDYGVEICSTNGRPANFAVTNFDVLPTYARSTSTGTRPAT